jgi:hypothetical protein
MRKPNLLILAAWIVHVASWFLPVTKVPDLNAPVPGWKAFRLAACGVWPCEGIQFQSILHKVLATTSVMTTLFFILCSLFILCSPWVVLRGSAKGLRFAASAAAAAFIFNIHWIVIFASVGAKLTIGYFLWWFSFLLLAIGLFRLPEIKKRELLPSRA